MEFSSSSPASLSHAGASSSPRDTASPAQARSTGRLWPRIKRAFARNLAGYLFLLPALLVFALFVWYPIILGFLMSFQNVDMINPATWVGLNNYHHVLADPLFGVAWRNTLEFTVYALIFGYATPVILAICLNEMRHGKGYFRLAYYLPVMLPPIVTAFLWKWIYNPDSGLLNALLAIFHLPGGLWLETPSTALPALMIIATWGGVGTTMLIYLAALQGVPASLYEAAEIDGASIWRRLWHVTLPGIRPVLLLMLILQIVTTMQEFLRPFIITSGGPREATLTVVLLIYNYAFQDGDFGGASAISVLLFLFLAVFALIYMRMTRNSMEGD